MHKILIINGPNLNLLGKRQNDIYGDISFEEFLTSLREKYSILDIHYFQSNHEGAIIDKIQASNSEFEGLIINAGAYTHTSIAIADTIQAISVPVIEVHISNIYARESFRHHSYLSPYCKGVIVGLGLNGYQLAIESLLLGN